MRRGTDNPAEPALSEQLRAVAAAGTEGQVAEKLPAHNERLQSIEMTISTSIFDSAARRFFNAPLVTAFVVRDAESVR